MIAANLGLLVTMVAWGSLIPVLNQLLPTWDPYFLSAARYALAAPIFVLLLLVLEPRSRAVRAVASWRVWLLGAVGIGVFAPLYTAGIALANPVTAAILGATGPVVAALVAWAAYRVPFDRGLTSAILLTAAGGALATYQPSAAGAGFELRGGEALIFLASACWSWYSLAAQRWLHGHSQLRITGMTMLPGTVVAVGIYLLAAALGAADLPPALPVRGLDLGLFAWMVAGPVVAGVFLWNYGVRMLGVVVASVFLNLAPVVAISITAALGTWPTAPQLAGGALVLGGVLSAQRRGRAAPANPRRAAADREPPAC